MKLNTKKLYIISVIFLLAYYHFTIHNGLEKMFCQTYFDYNDIRRPLPICDCEFNSSRLFCTGMPSGHAETITIFCLLLYLYNFIPIWLSIIIIMIVVFQRVAVKMHTFQQTLVGRILGLIYAVIYKYFNLSIYGFLLVFSIGVILLTLSVYKIDQKVHGPIPEWVDKNMIPSIRKKQDTPFYIKLGSIYANAIIQNRTFISWKQLEDYLDIIVDKIKSSGRHYDAVVGIKTGGAIISDYISLKLGLPNYKIKLSREEYNCDKQPEDTINDIINKIVLNKLGNYSVCEGIDDNLEGKNIILIDELVSSGKTMEESYNYLKEVKHVNEIYPACISLYKSQYKGSLNIHNVLYGTVLIWPWGYDN